MRKKDERQRMAVQDEQKKNTFFTALQLGRGEKNSDNFSLIFKKSFEKDEKRSQLSDMPSDDFECHLNYSFYEFLLCCAAHTNLSIDMRHVHDVDTFSFVEFIL